MISNLARRRVCCLTSAMLRRLQFLPWPALLLLLVLMPANALGAASKGHSITFGKWMTVQASLDSGAGIGDDKPITLRVRPLLVDTRIKEFVFGGVHDVTERIFVVRRAFRVNDSLPQESAAPPHWQWQRGGWMLIDRVTGRISAVHLPEFDALYSAASWYRDYAAYCGISEDGKKVYAMVTQLGQRKPVLKKLIEGASAGGEKADEGKDAAAGSACAVPGWQRAPARVSFEAAGAAKQTFAIRGHIVDLVNESEEQEDEEAAK